MPLTPADLLAIEQAVVRSWPALETEAIDGWLARGSSGGSERANSVSALAYTGTDLDRSLAVVERFYRQRGLPPKFTVSDSIAPLALDDELAARGWIRAGEHVTMAKDVGTARVAAPPPTQAQPIEIDRHGAPTPAWQQVYLQGLSENRRGAAMRLVAGTPSPRFFLAATRDGQTIGSALTIVDGPLASVQCMATLASARRTGAAVAILGAIDATAVEHGASRIYLQTDADNHAAISLYQRAGFAIVSRYHTRSLPA